MTLHNWYHKWHIHFMYKLKIVFQNPAFQYARCLPIIKSVEIHLSAPTGRKSHKNQAYLRVNMHYLGVQSVCIGVVIFLLLSPS